MQDEVIEEYSRPFPGEVVEIYTRPLPDVHGARKAAGGKKTEAAPLAGLSASAGDRGRHYGSHRRRSMGTGDAPGRVYRGV